MPNFIGIRPLVADLFRADGRADGHEEANSCFLQFCKRDKKHECLPARNTLRL